MKIIAIGTLKGGTGKTTITFNLGGVLAEKHKVLLIDVDPQCNLSASCGVNISAQTHGSSRDIFMEDNQAYHPEDLVVKTPIQELPNLDIIPSHMLMTAVEFFLVNRPARESILKNYIQDNIEFFGQYDYILLDTNPSMSVINQNAFLLADSIVLVTDISEDGISGVELFCHLWENVRKAHRLPDNVKALVINLADRRINLTKELKEYCEDNVDLLPLLVDKMVYSKVIYKDARMSHMPVNIIKGGEDAAKDISAVMDALFEKEVF